MKKHHARSSLSFTPFSNFTFSSAKLCNFHHYIPCFNPFLMLFLPFMLHLITCLLACIACITFKKQIDLNNANIRAYLKLPGMYPNVASKVRRKEQKKNISSSFYWGFFRFFLPATSSSSSSSSLYKITFHKSPHHSPHILYNITF